MLWETGSAQADTAELLAENIDWQAMTLIYRRRKLRDESEPCVLRIGPALAAILKTLPQSGLCFQTSSRLEARRGQQSFGGAADCLGSRALPCTASAFRGPSVLSVAVIPNALLRQLWGTPARPFIELMWGKSAVPISGEDYGDSAKGRLIPFPSAAPSLPVTPHTLLEPISTGQAS